MRHAAAVLLVGLLVSVGRGHAQESFEVAVIKKNEAGSRVPSVPAMFLPGGRWQAQNVTLAAIVRSAFDLPAGRLVGLPKWADTERFTINARAPEGTAPATVTAMAKQLLADRFDLRAHVERRAGIVHALVRAHASGVLGPGLRQSTEPCEHAQVLRNCNEKVGANGGALSFHLKYRPLTDLLTLSSARLEIGDPIVVGPGLEGRFDIDLEFVPFSALRSERPPENGLPLAAAVVDQLGLRFEERKDFVDILVVDSVSVPALD